MTEQQPTRIADDLGPAELIGITLLAVKEVEEITLGNLTLIYEYTGVKPSEIVEAIDPQPGTENEESND